MKNLVLVSLLVLFAYTGIAQTADAISGIWWNDEKTTKIKVEKKDGKYIGTIVYMIPEKYVNGKSPVDDKNPDPALQSRPVVGLQILSGFVYNTSKKEWASGKIYDPKTGKTYDCYACHDNHQAEEMETAHLAEGISDYATCASCHPTGVEGEAGRLRDEGLSPQGIANIWETSNLLNLAMELEDDKEGE